MAKNLKSYDKYSVKVGRDGQLMFNKDGSPVLDEKLVSNVRLDEPTVSLLNRNVNSFGEYFVLVEPAKEQTVKKDEPAKETKTETGTVITTVEVFIPDNYVKDLSLEKLKGLTDDQVEQVLKLVAKKGLFALLGVEPDAKQMQTTRHAQLIAEVIEKLKSE